MLAVALFGGAVSPVEAEPGPVNLPVYTSPIDVTGLKLQLHTVAPDRETGKPVETVLPVGLLPPSLNQLFATPLSAQFDQYWNARDPKTGKTPREVACDGEDGENSKDGEGGIKQQVANQVAKIGPGFSAYDISCDLASSGTLVAQQSGSTVTLGYLLTNNTVSFTTTTPATCKAGRGVGFMCPNDPRFTVHFATQVVTPVRAAGLCQVFAGSGTVYVTAASIDSNNAAAEVGRFVLGDKFVAAEVAMKEAVRKQPLPLDGLFDQLRTSDACTGKLPGVSGRLAAFSDFEVEINMREGIILRASHPGIAAPSVDAPSTDAGAPSFFRPMLSTTQPVVTAGDVVQVIGQHFPLNAHLDTTLSMFLRHAGTVCAGGATELEWGPVAGPLRVDLLRGDAQGTCAPAHYAANLTPSTAYQFRARDCDSVTCSPWSATMKTTTTPPEASRAKVALVLDGDAAGTAAPAPAPPAAPARPGPGREVIIPGRPRATLSPTAPAKVLGRISLGTTTTQTGKGKLAVGTTLGTANVDAQGNFVASVTIPAGTAAGAHTLRAIDGDTNAEAVIQVIAPPAAGGTRASIMMVAQLKGETGCPNHMISSTQTDSSFMLFGAGLAAGRVTIRLDTAAGATLGAATVRADGSICERIQGVAADKAGPHTLVAVLNNAVVAKAAVSFVLPSGVR